MILHTDDTKPQERERARLIGQYGVGITVQLTDIPTDVLFYGLEDGRRPVMIGVEVKKPQDMADSAVRSGRLVQQFRNAQDYGCEHLFVVFQGEIREGAGGLLEHLVWDYQLRKFQWKMVENPSITYVALDNFMNTLEIQGGIGVKRAKDQKETARQIVDLYNWWQRPPEEHQSLERFHQPVWLGGQVPLLRRMVKEVDGVGWTRSADFFNYFADKGMSTLDVLSLPAREYKNVKGVGPKTAETIEQDLHRLVVRNTNTNGKGNGQ